MLCRCSKSSCAKRWMRSRNIARLWCTINEPNVYALSGYVTGDFPACNPGVKMAMQVMANMLRAHAAPIALFTRSSTRRGSAMPTTIARWFPNAPGPRLIRLMRNIRYNGLNMAFPSGISTGVMRTPVGKYPIPEARGTQDYFGLNYYSMDTVWFDLRNRKELFTAAGFPEDADLSDTRFIANLPAGLFQSIKWVEKTYPNLPILITENGVEDADDHLRPRYLAQHVHQMWRAVNFNWPVKGYFHWTLVDNFEWERGWTQRFGLWALDVETQQRTKRPSADLYAEICKENGLSSPKWFRNIAPK